MRYVTGGLGLTKMRSHRKIAPPSLAAGYSVGTSPLCGSNDVSWVPEFAPHVIELASCFRNHAYENVFRCAKCVVLYDPAKHIVQSHRSLGLRLSTEQVRSRKAWASAIREHRVSYILNRMRPFKYAPTV